MAHILFFSGSIRKGSFNTKLAKAAYEMALKHDGITVELIDLADYPMPLMNEDLEKNEGMPAKAAEFKELLQKSDGFFIASPEYNGFFTPLLKNAIDWASRGHTDSAYSNDSPTFQGKVAAIAGTSPGGLGGLRGLPHLRVLLSGIGTHVIPAQTAIGGANDAFDDKGHLTNDSHIKMLSGQIDQFIKTVKAFNA